MNTSDAVQFLQGLSREKLAACYGRADVFALPSTSEGFGLVFLEAIALGLPIVAAAAVGSTDLVENEINGLLVPAHNPVNWPMF
jgi:glycosyltransferase involved in cell wall biosynthesis